MINENTKYFQKFVKKCQNKGHISIKSQTYFYVDVLAHRMSYITQGQKQKYRGMFETQKSRNKTSSGDIGLNIRTLASPKVGQDQVSGGVSVLCWHAALVANVLWKPLAIG